MFGVEGSKDRVVGAQEPGEWDTGRGGGGIKDQVESGLRGLWTEESWTLLH